MNYKGYTAIVKWSDEDESFRGEVAGTDDWMIFYDETIDEAHEGLKDVVDSYLEHCEKKGIVPCRPVPELVRRALQAASAGEDWGRA